MKYKIGTKMRKKANPKLSGYLGEYLGVKRMEWSYIDEPFYMIYWDNGKRTQWGESSIDKELEITGMKTCLPDELFHV